MRRAYRAWLPVLARCYPGWDWSRIDDMPEAEIAEFIHALPDPDGD